MIYTGKGNVEEYAHSNRMWILLLLTLKSWKDKNITNIPLSVNISSKDLCYLDIYKFFTDLVQKYETMLNEVVAEDNRIIREINDKREIAYKENYDNVDEEHSHELHLLRYENVARINFVEVKNSLINSMYDPMSEGF